MENTKFIQIINELCDEIEMSMALPLHLRPQYWVRKHADHIEFYWSMVPDPTDLNAPVGEKIFLDGTREMLFSPPASEEGLKKLGDPGVDE